MLAILGMKKENREFQTVEAVVSSLEIVKESINKKNTEKVAKTLVNGM